MFIALEMVYYFCFSFGGNLDFLQKKFFTSTSDHEKFRKKPQH